jgi:hypothetical protein
VKVFAGESDHSINQQQPMPKLPRSQKENRSQTERAMQDMPFRMGHPQQKSGEVPKQQGGYLMVSFLTDGGNDGDGCAGEVGEKRKEEAWDVAAEDGTKIHCIPLEPFKVPTNY